MTITQINMRDREDGVVAKSSLLECGWCMWDIEKQHTIWTMCLNFPEWKDSNDVLIIK